MGEFRPPWANQKILEGKSTKSHGLRGPGGLRGEIGLSVGVLPKTEGPWKSCMLTTR
jgi:hypothetical protein